MVPHPTCLPAVVPVRDVLAVLSNTTHHGFPVISISPDAGPSDGSVGQLEGLVLRSQLLVLLRKRCVFCPSAFCRAVSRSHRGAHPAPCSTATARWSKGPHALLTPHMCARRHSLFGHVRAVMHVGDAYGAVGTGGCSGRLCQTPSRKFPGSGPHCTLHPRGALYMPRS